VACETGSIRPAERGRAGAVVRELARFFDRIARACDAVDEAWARRRREALGRRGRLLSWHRDADGRWRARLSGPGATRTVERRGRTRAAAIARSVRALSRATAFRAGAASV
jgi:hypothetical protein